MPWSASDMAKKGAGKPGMAANIANAVLRECLASGKSAKVCEPMAIRIALAQSNKQGAKHD